MSEIVKRVADRHVESVPVLLILIGRSLFLLGDSGGLEYDGKRYLILQSYWQILCATAGFLSFGLASGHVASAVGVHSGGQRGEASFA
jgi:hypothetical protein